MKHTLSLQQKVRNQKEYYGRLEQIDFTPVCSCGWKGRTRDYNSRWYGGPSKIRHQCVDQWNRHVKQYRQQHRYKTSKRMELVGQTPTGREIWVGYLYGDIPPGYRFKDGIQRHNGFFEVSMGGQLESGKLYPWIVWRKLTRPEARWNESRATRWRYEGAFSTKEEAILSARRKLGEAATLDVDTTTYTPRIPDFTQYLRRLADQIDAAKTPEQKARILKRLKKINAAFDLVKEAERRMIEDMTRL